MNDIIDKIISIISGNDEPEIYPAKRTNKPDRLTNGEDYSFERSSDFPDVPESRRRFLSGDYKIEDNKKKRFSNNTGSVKIGKDKSLNREIALKAIWNLENPQMKGKEIVNGQERFYPIHEYNKEKKIDTWSIGPGLDLIYGVLKGQLDKYKKRGMSRQEVEDLAYKELNRHAKAVYDAFIDRGISTRPDTISHGVILNAAQTRYHLGNIIDRMQRFGNAAVLGDTNKMYNALTNDENLIGNDRMNKMKTYDPYYGYGGWRSEKERKGIIKKRR